MVSRSRLARPLGPAGKVALAAEVLLVYARTRRRMRGEQLPDTVAALRRGPPARERPSPEDAASAARLARAVMGTVDRLPTDGRCLIRSLVLTAMLARRGLGGALVIGVRPGETFAAHAWVELAGEPLLPTGEPAYERLTDL